MTVDWIDPEDFASLHESDAEELLSCTHCGGNGECTDGADPLGDCPDEPHRCHACGGSGRGDLLMPEAQRIYPVLVEKAAKAVYEAERPALERLHPQSYFQRWDDLQSQSMREGAIAKGRAVVAVFFDELGLKEEETVAASRLSGGREVRHRRYRSDWRPVEQGDER